MYFYVNIKNIKIKVNNLYLQVVYKYLLTSCYHCEQ